MEISDEILTEISYVQMSKYRIKVMKSLDGDVKIPSIISKDSGINPEARKGRLYRLTDKGDIIIKNLK